MKGNKLWFIFAGVLLLLAGSYGIFSFNNAWAPILVIIGSVSICLAASVPMTTLREALAYCPAVGYKPIPHEPALIARIFMSMSCIARCGGILALEKFMNGKYDNFIYHMGKNMVIDGMDPDFVKSVLLNNIRQMQRRRELKVRYLRQIGFLFFYIGFSVSIIGGLAYGGRMIKAQEISVEGMELLIGITAIFLILGLLFAFLLSFREKNSSFQAAQIQRQILAGILAVQCGDSFNAILRQQYTFLSSEEVKLLSETPLLPEVQSYSEASYDKTVTAIRNSLREFNSTI
ncbi:hypothetical protein [Selenomonas sp. AE3005]|uniref:hypothetical protein n=1 Tax=Selenomonas sp. AE3005 TaxID=1485543 RepID=UPI00048878FE|nr:hypothetical protein [Selenomonas sp. AE3005]